MTALPAVRRAEDLPPILGESFALRRAVALAQRFAATDLPLLLIGATGTGKELFAQHIHAWSGCRGELVDVNAAAIPRELVEPTLFGVRKGSYTGAVESAAGLIETADGGALFLDEVCSLPLEAQAKLLRTLESGEFRRVGESTKRRSRFRLISAAQEHFENRIATGTFRLDLLQRLSGVVIELPVLRDRLADVGLLAARFAAEAGRGLAAGTTKVLEDYPWPGNVRELRAVIQRASCLCRGPLAPDVLRESLALGARVSAPATVPAPLLEVCARHGWKAAAIARALEVDRSTLYRRLRDLGVSLRREAARSRSQFAMR